MGCEFDGYDVLQYSAKDYCCFSPENGTLRGRIEDMPMELFAEWANEARGERKLRRVVEEAGEVFLTAYLKARFEKT